jgi:nucleoside-diphosphate-sugar epimerase
MRILITGSNGFIGSYLSSYFREVGHQVFVCGRDKLDLLDSDAVNNFFKSNYMDLVIHTALVGRENLYEPRNSDKDDIIVQNLKMWENLKNNQHRFKFLINFGTGNEFDTDKDINFAQEDLIFERDPIYTYGYVKNLIARDLRQYENFFNLRLFGVFHYSEIPKRFFKKLFMYNPKQEFHIYEDKYFDFINLEDIPPIIEIIAHNQCKHQDMNIVYDEKVLLSDLAREFNDIKNLNLKIVVDKQVDNNYTGDYTNFYSYNTPKLGRFLGYLRY